MTVEMIFVMNIPQFQDNTKQDMSHVYDLYVKMSTAMRRFKQSDAGIQQKGYYSGVVAHVVSLVADDFPFHLR